MSLNGTEAAELWMRIQTNENHVSEMRADLRAFRAEMLEAIGITTRAVIDEARDIRGRLIDVEKLLTKKRPQRRKRR